MTFMLRDRPDGQVEIIIQRPILVGVFPERDMAERVCALLQADDPELPEDHPSGFATAAADVEETVRAFVAEQEDKTRNVLFPQYGESDIPKANLPVPVPEAPRAPAMLKVLTPHALTEAQIDAAFSRIAGGEKLSDVARDIDLPMGQLRGMWANHKRQLQKHMADGGQQPCSLCEKPFTPSVSHPDTCARCSHG